MRKNNEAQQNRRGRVIITVLLAGGLLLLCACGPRTAKNSEEAALALEAADGVFPPAKASVSPTPAEQIPFPVPKEGTPEWVATEDALVFCFLENQAIPYRWRCRVLSEDGEKLQPEERTEPVEEQGNAAGDTPWVHCFSFLCPDRVFEEGEVWIRFENAYLDPEAGEEDDLLEVHTYCVTGTDGQITVEERGEEAPEETGVKWKAQVESQSGKNE